MPNHLLSASIPAKGLDLTASRQPEPGRDFVEVGIHNANQESVHTYFTLPYGKPVTSIQPYFIRHGMLGGIRIRFELPLHTSLEDDA